jgi:hypothetical protein
VFASSQGKPLLVSKEGYYNAYGNLGKGRNRRIFPKPPCAVAHLQQFQISQPPHSFIEETRWCMLLACKLKAPQPAYQLHADFFCSFTGL